MPLYIEKVSAHIMELAFSIHTEHGPGLLEKAYEFCLYTDLNDLGYYVKDKLAYQSRIMIIDLKVLIESISSLMIA